MSGQYEESYSIWVMPKGRLAERLQAECDHLASQYPAAPHFPPHVTVLGDIKLPRDQAVATLEQMAAKTKKYHINFLDVARGDFYYQCIYMLCAKQEGTMAAAAAAREMYQMQTNPYMPHLSLLYADLEEGEKQQLVEATRQRLYGEGSGHDTLLIETGFAVDSLTLWYTPTEDKSLASWCKVAEVPLQ